MKTLFLHFNLLIAGLFAVLHNISHGDTQLNSMPGLLSNHEPAELINFEAIPKSNKIELSWNLLPKSKYTYLILERSKNGSSFEKITTIEAGGSGDQLIQYVETDYKPFKGKTFYRLVLKDANKKVRLTKTVEVLNQIQSVESGKSMKTSLKKVEKPVLVVLSDSHGREHLSKVRVITEDTGYVGIDFENKLIPGKYTVKATSYNPLYQQMLEIR